MQYCNLSLRHPGMKPSIYQRVCLLLVLYCIADHICPVNGSRRSNNLQCTCGLANLDDRILGGDPATDNEFPWQAMILYKNQFFCGGTVINDRYVLTAAHCVHTIASHLLSVVLGRNSQSRLFWWREKILSVTEKKVHERHESYKENDVRDIALLRLNETIIFNSFIRPVCLPPRGKTFDGEFATITGWGFTENDKVSNSLLKAVIRVMSDEECLLSKLGQLVARDPSSMLCAYASRRDSCQGDSGGPLLYKSPNGKTIQIGIVSFGYKCGVVDYPGIYTKLTSFRNWIDRNTMDANYCRS